MWPQTEAASAAGSAWTADEGNPMHKHWHLLLKRHWRLVLASVAFVACVAGYVVWLGWQKEELRQLQGVWDVVSYTEDRKTVQQSGLRWTIRGTTLTQGNTQGMVESRWAMRVDAARQPWEMDITQLSGGGSKGFTVLGIYELDGDELRVCSTDAPAHTGAKRPTDFTAGKDSGRTLITFRRVPPKE